MRLPIIENSQQTFENLSRESFIAYYGENPPKELVERFFNELDVFKKNGNEIYFLLLNYIKNKSNQFYVRGSFGSSFIAFLICGTDINPLKPHYYCKECKTIEFIPDTYDGYDLSDRNCSKCDGVMKGDGHNIPFETLAGLDGEREPYFELDVSKNLYENAEIILKSFFKNDIVIHPSLISNNNTEVCDWSYIIIPKEYINEVETVTIGETKTTKRDFWDMGKEYLKINFLQWNLFENLIDYSNQSAVSFNQIPMNDKKILNLFVKKKIVKDKVMLESFLELCKKLKPQKFSDLSKAFGVYCGSFEPKENLITCREDVFYLALNYENREKAFEIMENVRKGKGARLYSEEHFENYPEWFYDFISNTLYLWPKAGLIYNAKLYYYSEWYKTYFPGLVNNENN